MNQKTEYTPRSAARSLVLTGLGLTCLLVPARSQEGLGGELFELDAVTFIANKTELPLDRIGSSVDILDSLDLQSDRSTFLLDSLRTVPGLNLRNNGGPGAAFGITTRGLNSNRPKVLIDGIEVSNPSNGRIVNFGNLFTANVNRVEVLKGPQSSLYGADALAGLINVRTGGPDGGTLELSGGSFGTYQGSLAYQQSTEDLSYSFGLSRYESDGFSAQDPDFGEAWADDDAYDNTSVNARFAYKLGNKSEVSFATYYNEHYSEYDPGDPASVWGEPFADSHSEGDQLFTKLGFTSTLSEAWSTRINFARTEVESLSRFSAGAPSRTLGRRYDLDWQNTVEASDAVSVVAGAQLKRDEDRLAESSRDDRAFYAEGIFSLSEALDWTLGARYDDNEDYGSETTYRSTFSYRVPDSATRLRGSFGSSFQAPTFFQLSETNGFGNPDIGPETGLGWDFGIEHRFAESDIAMSITYFGYDIENKIAWDASLASETRPWGTYANVEQYKSEGVESSLSWQASDDFTVSLAHTYVSAEYEDGVEAERVPRHTASLSANWSALENALQFNAIVQHTSSQFSLRGDTEKQPSYTVVDLATSYRFEEGYSVWLRLDNILDEDYEEIATYQTAGASASAGVRLSF